MKFSLISVPLGLKTVIQPVIGDHGKVLEIVTTLINTSIASVNEGQANKILCELELDTSLEHRLIIRVSDTGEGLSKSEKEKIINYERQKASDAAEPLKVANLIRVRKEVEAMKGRVFVVSKVGEGTSVTTVIPSLKKSAIKPKPEP